MCDRCDSMRAALPCVPADVSVVTCDKRECDARAVATLRTGDDSMLFLCPAHLVEGAVFISYASGLVTGVMMPDEASTAIAESYMSGGGMARDLAREFVDKLWAGTNQVEWL